MEVCQAGGWEEMPLQNRQCGPSRGASVDKDSLVKCLNTVRMKYHFIPGHPCVGHNTPLLSRKCYILGDILQMPLSL